MILKSSATSDATNEHQRARQAKSNQPTNRIEKYIGPIADDYFFETGFEDEYADGLLLSPMPASGNSRSQKAPSGTPMYLAYLWTVPILSADQERHQFRKLNYLKHLLAKATTRAAHDANQSDKVGNLRELEARIQQVRNQIVEANLRLVVSLAKKYAKSGAAEFDELVSDGNTALMRAVDLFDYRKRVRFSTYAYTAIRNACFGLHRLEKRYRSTFVNDDNGSTETLIGDAGEMQKAESRARESLQKIQQLMSELDEREQRIMKHRFGIGQDHDGISFRAIAKDLGISPTRTVQLFHRSIEAMRRVAQ